MQPNMGFNPAFMHMGVPPPMMFQFQQVPSLVQIPVGMDDPNAIMPNQVEEEEQEPLDVEHNQRYNFEELLVTIKPPIHAF